MSVVARSLATVLAVSSFIAVGVSPRAVAAEPAPSAAAVAFFEAKVRPLLAERCYRCHGPQKQRGGLRLDSRVAALAGGDSGPAVTPGQPDASLLIKAVRYKHAELQMPPDKKLTKPQIDDLVRWVQLGAPWPGAAAVTAAARPGEFRVTDADRAYWAYRPVRRPPVPAVRDAAWIANPIDAFLVARLEAAGLRPNPPATRRELLRRASFDLTGLPPTPEAIAAFEADPSPDAWEKIIDRLLASPHYGERWGRHWLDVVRFAQSNGYERDDEKPFAWRYRDYVIRAFNDDKPYDQFVREQLAGDLLSPPTADGIIATGFYRLGVWDDEPDDARQALYDELDDILATTGQAFLGMTINCARCHDHKFDPVSQRDYYRLLAYFHNVERYGKAVVRPDSSVLVPLGPPDEVRRWREEIQRKSVVIDRALKGAKDESERRRLRRQRERLGEATVPFPVALAVREQAGPGPKTHVLIRGNAGTPGEEVQPGLPEVLRTATTAPAPPKPGRLAVAEWVAGPHNPLTARVIVNRIWLHHFGRGLVPTPNDFGKAGVPPTHPELLDWLAAEFIAGGWKVKALHKTILLSHAYQMSARADRPDTAGKDEGNLLYWRQNPRRLEAEAIRDAVLAVSDSLNPEMGGRGIFPRLSRQVVAGLSRPGLGWELSPEAELHRRSVYIFVKRTLLAPELETFDYTNTASPLGERPTTTVAPQALLLLNSDFMQEHAAAFAERLVREAGDDPAAQVRRAYQLAVGRAPTSSEEHIALSYLQRQAAAWQAHRPPLLFQPLVPSSLSGGYLRQLRPTDFLGGPRDGWSYHRGRWGNGYEGIESVDPAAGPFALWQGATFADAVVEGQLFLHNASELGGVLLRAVPAGDRFTGYELVLSPRGNQVALRRHDEKGVRELAAARVTLRTNQWHGVRIQDDGGKLCVWLDGGPKPILNGTDDKPLTRPGAFGLRTWGAGLSARDLVIATKKRKWRVDDDRPPDTAAARRHALQALCLVVLNLNEFVYVD